MLFHRSFFRLYKFDVHVGWNYPSRQDFSKTRLNAQKNEQKPEKLNVFRSQLRFPTVSVKRSNFAFCIRVNACSSIFSRKTYVNTLEEREKMVVFFILEIVCVHMIIVREYEKNGRDKLHSLSPTLTFLKCRLSADSSFSSL